VTKPNWCGTSTDPEFNAAAIALILCYKFNEPTTNEGSKRRAPRKKYSLGQAQDIIYDAWEVRDAGERVALSLFKN
jgi:hypothetical protein